MFRYKKVEIDNIQEINNLGANGWRVISSSESYVLMEEEYDPNLITEICLMPVERTINDTEALYKCQKKVKRYVFNNSTEPTEFITIDEFKNHDLYTDNGEYEAYLSDGFYFIGTNISRFSIDELDGFIKENKYKFRNPEKLCIYFIDYPEDK